MIYGLDPETIQKDIIFDRENDVPPMNDSESTTMDRRARVLATINALDLLYLKSIGDRKSTSGLGNDCMLSTL